MDEHHQHEPSHLFLVRLWLDQGDGEDGGGSMGHGKVQHVISGEAGAFSDWSSLVDRLASLASAQPKPPQSSTASEKDEPGA